MLPPFDAPPITTIRRSAANASGRRAARRATFVSGPTAASVTSPGRSNASRAIRSTACSPAAIRDGAGRFEPSSPVSPCVSDESSLGTRTSGRSAPAASSRSERPTRSSTRSPFAVVLASGTLPATVVIARTSNSGLARASRIAIASSIPGSQSMISGWGAIAELDLLLGQYGFGDLDVKEDLLDIVVILERIDHLQHLATALIVDLGKLLGE